MKPYQNEIKRNKPIPISGMKSGKLYRVPVEYALFMTPDAKNEKIADLPKDSIFMFVAYSNIEKLPTSVWAKILFQGREYYIYLTSWTSLETV